MEAKVRDLLVAELRGLEKVLRFVTRHARQWAEVADDAFVEARAMPGVEALKGLVV